MPPASVTRATVIANSLTSYWKKKRLIVSLMTMNNFWLIFSRERVRPILVIIISQEREKKRKLSVKNNSKA
jgi:hypothetical protein